MSYWSKKSALGLLDLGMVYPLIMYLASFAKVNRVFSEVRCLSRESCSNTEALSSFSSSSYCSSEVFTRTSPVLITQIGAYLPASVPLMGKMKIGDYMKILYRFVVFCMRLLIWFWVPSLSSSSWSYASDLRLLSTLIVFRASPQIMTSSLYLNRI